MSERVLCVHGHFYQPPREDPLTGQIPLEPGASPYTNWNERILAECYAPNALAGNFGRMSFNIGPTLFEWLEKVDPRTTARIIAQERSIFDRFGVGNAMAQTYHHAIMPLATYQDKVTQVRWGIADYKYRFGHNPAGMWLPETAADDDTLAVLADHGIEFTILAPWQALEPNVDTAHPYQVELPNRRKMAVFFYNQVLSTMVSFEPAATVNADVFLRQVILPQFPLNGSETVEPSMVLIATDGELYGHHQPHREKFLAWLLDGALSGAPVETTFPALWLKKHPVYRSMGIVQNSSWSCHHGVTRWSGPCGCAANGGWKAYLRKGLERIATEIDEIYVREVTPVISQPWELRHRYIHVLLGQTNLEDLASDMAGRHLESDTIQKLSLMLRAQNERQKMFASCGWFFEDFDRIEPRNAVAYAAQAVWLMYRATGIDLSGQALSWLHPVTSWRSELRADEVFSKHIIRAQQHPEMFLRG